MGERNRVGHECEPEEGRSGDVVGCSEADHGGSKGPGREEVRRERVHGTGGGLLVGILPIGLGGAVVDALGVGEGAVGLDAVGDGDDAGLERLEVSYTEIYMIWAEHGSCTKKSHFGRRPACWGRKAAMASIVARRSCRALGGTLCD